MGTLTVYVHPAHFPWLVVALLDIAHETDWDFDFPSLSTLRPRDGMIDIGGPQREDVRTELRRRLDLVGIELSEVRVAA